MITEVYMGPGDFRVSMRVDTPWLMNDIDKGGYLVVTPQHLGDPRMFTNDAILDAARYTGIVLEVIWTNGVLTLEGAGLEWILGDLDGVGWPCPSVSYSADPVTDVIALTSGTGIIPAASFSIGATITGGNYTGTHGSSETIKEVLTIVMDQLGNHYKIDPDGTINTEAIANGNVYLSTPEIVFVRDNWGSDAMYTGLPVASLSSKDSIREWLDASNTFYYGLNNSSISRSDTTDPLTTREILGTEYKLQEIRVPYTQLAASNAAVGDNVYIHDPGSGFFGSDTIKFRGQYLMPAIHRVQEASWPVVEGMGIYYRPGSSSTVTTEEWIDLTFTTKFVAASRAQTYLRALVITEGGS